MPKVDGTDINLDSEAYDEGNILEGSSEAEAGTLSISYSTRCRGSCLNNHALSTEGILTRWKAS
jgi:hypothetical protein